MSTISAVSGSAWTTYATPAAPPAEAMRPAPPRPPMDTKGENAVLKDSQKLNQLSSMLEMDSKDVQEQATSPSSLVSMLQDKGIGYDQMRSVMSSGDLLDVRA
ncbi:MAG: hypothetical protein ABW046_08160 [Actinoplanes sp.]